jgi:glycosyltransferase involved in cell wall biosynthesis
MIYIAYIALLFSSVKFINTLINLIFIQRLGRSKSLPEGLVSILIPARNEQDCIGELLTCLQDISYTNTEIIVFNDESTDNTAVIVNKYAENDKRIRLINSEGLPKGWSGKNYACHILASNAKGRYYLFLDADVRVYDTIIEDAVYTSNKYGLGLLSVFQVQIMKTWGERTVVPLMNYILLTLLPLIFVRISPFKSHSAANGQFMFFESYAYNKLKPHEKFRNTVVEDIAIAHDFKKQKLKTACLLGDERIRCRMYESRKDALHGFSKNVLMFFGNSFVLAVLFWLFSALGFVPVILTNFILFIAYFAIITTTKIIVAIISKQNVIHCLILSFHHQYNLLLMITKAKRVHNLFEYSWKGRKVYSL